MSWSCRGHPRLVLLSYLCPCCFCLCLCSGFELGSPLLFGYGSSSKDFCIGIFRFCIGFGVLGLPGSQFGPKGSQGRALICKGKPVFNLRGFREPNEGPGGTHRGEGGGEAKSGRVSFLRPIRTGGVSKIGNIACSPLCHWSEHVPYQS